MSERGCVGGEGGLGTAMKFLISGRKNVVSKAIEKGTGVSGEMVEADYGFPDHGGLNV